MKNLAKVVDIKCVFLYPMPDSSLLITICFLIFHFFMYAYHRSRMTAEVNCVFSRVLNTCLSFLNEVMASEPFFEEQSDAAKVSETPYPTNGSGKNLGRGCKISMFLPVYAHLPLSPHKARHLSPYSGEADTKEERNQVFL